MKRYRSLRSLNRELIDCRACPRLVEWREHIAIEKRAAYRSEEYWGRPVPGFGDAGAALVVVGLAPGAHGANRTGRMFTGDRSGDWLYRALHRAGFASRPESTASDDGLELDNAYITAPVHCVPPANRPSVAERDECRAWFEQELRLLGECLVIVCLGRISYDAVWRHLGDAGVELPSPRPRFEHARELHLPGSPVVLCSYHPSQQNTFTGRLTEEMFDAVFIRARQLIGPEIHIH